MNMNKKNWIHNRKMKTGVKTEKRAMILRKIIGIMKINGLDYEQLECGHNGRLLSSMGTGGLFGVREAQSRRYTMRRFILLERCPEGKISPKNFFLDLISDMEIKIKKDFTKYQDKIFMALKAYCMLPDTKTN